MQNAAGKRTRLRWFAFPPKADGSSLMRGSERNHGAKRSYPAIPKSVFMKIYKDIYTKCLKYSRFYDNMEVEDFLFDFYKAFSSRGVYMKKLCSVFICISILLSSVLFAIPASATAPDAQTVEEQQLAATDSYYYDRLNDYQKSLYNYLKELYDTWRPEPGEYRVDVTQYVSADYAEDREDKFIADFIYANLALCADDPYYELRFRLHGAYVDDYSSEVPAYILEFIYLEIATEDNIAQIDARVNQIVSAIGEGDRYTKLYKLAHFFISDTFYDPYLDEINSFTHSHNQLETRGAYYDSRIYGIFLENIAVCGGFAHSVKTLCNELDIPCIIMSNASHAWNLVQMEDGSWYRFDMTNAVGIGWDGERNFDYYIENAFLNNNTLVIGDFYNDPYMISINKVPLVTEFPEHAEKRYEYKGSTTDFSYTLPQSEYLAGEPKFIYKVNPSPSPECTIINYEGRQEGDLVIPAEIDGYTVTKIAPKAFYYCTGFDGKLVLPDTLISIGKAAFAGCYNLSGVDFPDSLSTISEDAFIGCKGLTELTFPNSVVRIDTCAFFDCTSLETVRLGEHIQRIENYALGFARGYETYQGITIYAPEGSAAQKYASDNEIDFSVQGTLCDFVDDDGEWKFFGDEHFHTCSHGIKIDVADHTNEQGYFNCSDRCDVCRAQYCLEYGFMETVEVLKDASPATCLTPEYSGDIWCLCDSLLAGGEYIGDTIPHTPANEEWIIAGDVHYQLCECGEQINTGLHCGGTATTTESAKCSMCGAEYGALFHEHSFEDSEWKFNSSTHWHLCNCGLLIDEEPHSGGTATETERAKCEICGARYGELVGTKTGATSTEPQSEEKANSEDNLNGCGAVLEMGSMSVIGLSLFSFICFRKKED